MFTSLSGKCRLSVVFLLSLIVLCTNYAYSQDVIPGCGEKELIKLVASDKAYADRFGGSVAVDGTIAVVGSSGDDHSVNGAGSAYVYYFDGSSWVQQAKLTASDAEADDGFGISVAIEGDVIVVGASGGRNSQNFADSGAVYVFVKPPTGWTNMTETAKLTSEYNDNFDSFGRSVAISSDSGDIIVVGSPHAGQVYSGSGWAFLYEKPPAGWADTSVGHQLYPTDSQLGGSFGGSVSISGDVVVVGAAGVDSGSFLSTGAAYVFEKPVSGWTDMSQTAKLTASDAAAGDRLGRSVSISGDVVLVGAPGVDDDDDGDDFGAVYVFEELAEGWIDKTERSKFTAPDADAEHSFGVSVAINNNLAVIGAMHRDELSEFDHSSAYIYTIKDRILTGQVQIPTPVNFEDEFSFSVATGDGFVIIGAPGTRATEGHSVGAAYVMRFFAPCEGQVLHLAHGLNTTANSTRIDHPMANSNPDAIILVTPNRNPEGSPGYNNNAPIGVWWEDTLTYNRWNVFNQNLFIIPWGATFNLKIENPSDSAFVHTATAPNITLNWTTIDHPLTNGDPEALVFVTQTKNPTSGIGVSNNNPIGVWYDGSQWAIFNEFNWPNVAPPMPMGAAFNVVVAPGSDTVFVHTVTAENLWMLQSTLIDHPLLNGDRTAQLIVTQNYNPGGGLGVYNHAPIGVYFNTIRQEWGIYNEDGTSIPIGASFNVMILRDCEGTRIHCECMAVDYNGDGVINLLDFCQLSRFWLQDEPSVNIFAPGTINVLDLAEFMEHWLEKC